MKLYGFAGIALFVGTGWAMTSVAPEVQVDSPRAGLDAHETHSSASLLGQFRTNISAWLWVRTDLYLHNGVELRPMTEAEKKHGSSDQATTQDDLHSEKDIVTVVPSAERDFRGIFGDIERSTAAFKSMKDHDHQEPKAALPLFRLMTWLDPQFIPGWVVGSTVMARERNEDAYRKAFAYLEQGIAENPESIEIRGEYSRLKLSRQRDFDKAIPMLEEARRLAYTKKVLTVDDEAPLQEVYRWLALAYRESDQPEKMRQVAREGLQFFTDDVILRRMLVVPPMFMDPDSQNRWIEEHFKTAPPVVRDEHDDHGHEHHEHDGHDH